MIACSSSWYAVSFTAVSVTGTQRNRCFHADASHFLQLLGWYVADYQIIRRLPIGFRIRMVSNEITVMIATDIKKRNRAQFTSFLSSSYELLLPFFLDIAFSITFKYYLFYRKLMNEKKRPLMIMILSVFEYIKNKYLL